MNYIMKTKFYLYIQGLQDTITSKLESGSEEEKILAVIKTPKNWI